jgi:dolichyl-phosphate beta-glucosyltransferase
MTPNLSIVIPVYNEEKRLPNNLKKIISFLNKKKTTYEIVIIDDGSIDRTKDFIKKIQKRNKRIILAVHDKNLGKGAAVKTGMLSSKGKLVLMTDCDLSTPIEELDTLLPHIKNHDIVIGSRRLQEKKLGRLPERYRTFLGDIYYEMLRMVLLPSVKDTNCGFKLFKRKVIKDVFTRQRINRWGYDAEVLFISDKFSYSIKEVPVKWTHFTGSKVRVLDAVTKTLLELAQIKINNLRGRYD